MSGRLDTRSAKFMMLLLKGSRFASEQRIAYMDRCTKVITTQASDEQLQDAISIEEMRSLGELQLLSSVMATSGSLIKTRAPCTSHRDRKQSKQSMPGLRECTQSKRHCATD